MKCPKCEYLGFETGDRCKNCGYDFSLATSSAVTRDSDLPLHLPETMDKESADRWLDQMEARIDTVRSVSTPTISVVEPFAPRVPVPVPSPPAAAEPIPSPASAPGSLAAAASASMPVAVPRPAGVRKAASLPLFRTGSENLDEPLIKLPAAPRAPLSVRKTPERPKLRTLPKPPRRIEPEHESDPVLAFAEEPAASASVRSRLTPKPHATGAFETSGAARRLTAAVVDHAILLAIDATVVYFTFQIAGVPLTAWRDVPLVPLAIFLVLVKVSYFCVFTALGGQTVGKMATGIRVVADNNREVDPAQAVRRTIAALASFATAGIGFAPVVLGGDRRALHDRVAGTRVVGPSTSN
jgi:uncharacterized RDD family membrane protein YckC